MNYWLHFPLKHRKRRTKITRKEYIKQLIDQKITQLWNEEYRRPCFFPSYDSIRYFPNQY